MNVHDMSQEDKDWLNRKQKERDERARKASGRHSIDSIDCRHDFADKSKWMSYLETHGVVVLKNVLSKDEVSNVIKLYWDWAEGLKNGIDRNDRNTWDKERWPGHSTGITSSLGLAHSASAWFVRTRPKVKESFSTIWGEEDLITSFDAVLTWRPWCHDSPTSKDRYPISEGLHIDQSPTNKIGLHCVQGMIPMIDVNEKIGGLEVVPGTHLKQEELGKKYPRAGSDWVVLYDDDEYQGQGKLVKAEAGDLVLWDSRTIHGGIVGSGLTVEEELEWEGLARLSYAVCMTPKSKATAAVLKDRRKAFDKGWPTSHWPHEFTMQSMGGNITVQPKAYLPVTETPEVTALIGRSLQQTSN